MREYDSEKAKQRLLQRIRRDKRDVQEKRFRKVGRYAAVVLILLGLGYAMYRPHEVTEDMPSVAVNSDMIILQMPDGIARNLPEVGNSTLVDQNGQVIGMHEGSLLVYHRGKTNGKLAYNSLRVPNGKRFAVLLSDGTKVHLNSGSVLRYPVQFAKSGERTVALQGEAYFEVVEDRAHPFIVDTDRLDVQVMGTRFNVSAYPEDEITNAVLVEGSVCIFENRARSDSAKDYVLEPGQIATRQKRDSPIRISDIDTDQYTAWTRGKLVFNRMSFREIANRLERNYDVSIDNDYPALDDMRFTASFDTETLDEVLTAFSKNYPLRYAIDDNTVRIKKP